LIKHQQHGLKIHAEAKKERKKKPETDTRDRNTETMSFFIGMIIGISVGIGLIVAFAKYENIRSMRRSQLVNPIESLVFINDSWWIVFFYVCVNVCVFLG
jgi:NAD/NADP transhydrogenase beta subunit